jgi:hypothetical protein
LVTDCSLPRDVECERRLTDGGASREEDEIRFLETREDVVECRESGGDTAHPALMLLEMFKTLPGFDEFILDGTERAQSRRISHRKDELLRIIEDLFEIAILLVSELTDAASGVEEGSQYCFRLNDLGVVSCRTRRRSCAHELRKVCAAADILQHFLFFELARDSDHVDGLALAVQREHRIEDRAVLASIERVGRGNIGNFVHGAGVEHEGAQERSLGVDVLGRDAHLCHPRSVHQRSEQGRLEATLDSWTTRG